MQYIISLWFINQWFSWVPKSTRTASCVSLHKYFTICCYCLFGSPEIKEKQNWLYCMLEECHAKGRLQQADAWLRKELTQERVHRHLQLHELIFSIFLVIIYTMELMPLSIFSISAICIAFPLLPFLFTPLLPLPPCLHVNSGWGEGGLRWWESCL